MAKQTESESSTVIDERKGLAKLWYKIDSSIEYLFEQLSINIKGPDADGAGTINSIRRGIELKGYNLWILAAAALLACIGLDTNSAAVIIGAMLISPLMNPILGVGLGLGIDDPDSLFKSIQNLAVAVFMSLLISFLYFRFLTPLGEITPEIQARTAPTLLDAFVALFGGVAGIVSNSRREKSNAIPGVAIATALMPPLCSAGYGLANMEWTVFFGAFYLFFINAMVISFFTFLIVRYLEFNKPELKELADEELELENQEKKQELLQEEEVIRSLKLRQRDMDKKEDARKRKSESLVILKELKKELQNTTNEYDRIQIKNKIEHQQNIIEKAKRQTKEDTTFYKLVKKFMPLFVIISILPSIWFLWNLIQDRQIERQVKQTVEETLGDSYRLENLTIDDSQKSVNILINAESAIDANKKEKLISLVKEDGFEEVKIDRINLSEEDYKKLNSQVQQNFVDLQSEVEDLKLEINKLKTQLNPESEGEIITEDTNTATEENLTAEEDTTKAESGFSITK